MGRSGIRAAYATGRGKIKVRAKTEIVELPNHPWFVGVQYHPELKSRPNRPHPLFREFVGAALAYQDK